MDNLESTARELCATLLSSRATDRRKSAEVLKDFLSRNALGALLTKNTLRREGFNWNNLFDNIEEYILKVFDSFISGESKRIGIIVNSK